MDVFQREIVGRRTEVEQVRAVLDGLADGSAHCLAVTGEPGIGKTRLLAELGRMADARGHPVLRGKAAEFERDVPYALWADALDAYALARGAAEGDAALAAVLPSSDQPTTQPLADERYRTHRAMRRLLETLSVQAPLVLILDDLHWADVASLELLTALLRREPAAPVLLALGCRRGRIPEVVLAALALPIVQLLELEPLDDDDTLLLAGAELEPSQRDMVLGESGGNPFYALQLARRPAAAASAAASASADPGVPAAVAAALSEELRGLSPSALALLQAGAVAGDPHEPAIAFRIASLDDGSGLGALDELLEADLLRPTELPRMFAFRHPLVRRAVYAGIKGGSRIEAHRCAASVLAAAGASTLARAHHVERSASVGDADAIAVLEQAGDASARTSPVGAARWYAAALELVPETDAPARLQALVRLADALRSAGEATRSREVLLEALELVPRDAHLLTVQITAACASCEDFLGDHATARARLERVLEELGDDSSREARTVLLHLAAGAWFTLDFQRMQETAARCRDAARLAGDAGTLGAALSALALAHVMLAETTAAAMSATEAGAVFDALADLEYAERLEAVNHLGWAEYYLERYEDSIRHLERGVSVGRATGRGTFICLMQECRSLSEMLIGHPDVAAAVREDMVDAARVAGFDYQTVSALTICSAGSLMAGDLEAAGREAREALQLLDGAGGTVAGFARATAVIAAIETEHAARVAEPFLADAGGWELCVLPPSWRTFFQARLAEALVDAREPARAADSAAFAQAAAAEIGLPRTTALGLHAQAAVRLARGEHEAALDIALQARELALSAGARLDAARALRIAGKALAITDRDRAVAFLREAEAELEACGARRDRDDARRALRKLGARSEARGRAAAKDAGLGSLSAREREIAELVTQRKTNREVAADLFLSEKTVESHLRNIFFKLGAASRVDVAKMVELES